MSYTPTEWKAGDTVTSAKLNKLEQGIVTAGGGIVVEMTYVAEDVMHPYYISDIDASAIKAAFIIGTPISFHFNQSGGYDSFYLPMIGYKESNNNSEHEESFDILSPYSSKIDSGSDNFNIPTLSDTSIANNGKLCVSIYID